jgi:hypothetical protein
MNNVTSKPLKSESTAAPAPALSTPAGAGCTGLIGVVCLLVSVGPLLFLLNGGYSILGMAWMADRLGSYGSLFWALATTYTINVPIAARAGLPLAQPVLPWMMVFGMSFLQISLIGRRQASLWITGAGLSVSLFDYATTVVGLCLMPWLAGIGWLRWFWVPIAAVLAVPITFGIEGLIARVVRGR